MFGEESQTFLDGLHHGAWRDSSARELIEDTAIHLSGCGSFSERPVKLKIQLDLLNSILSPRPGVSL